MKRSPLNWALDSRLNNKRMVFIAGPRQVGKTTAIKKVLTDRGQEELYFNWDTPSVKKRFAQDAVFFLADIPAKLKQPLVALDEIHKYPKWKNILKGYFDEFHERMQFVVTGSARLDLFRKSGDSLVGRYFLYNMLPLGLTDVCGVVLHSAWHPQQSLDSIDTAPEDAFSCIENLFSVSGFPEPFYNGSKAFYTRWQQDYVSQLVKEDVRDLSRIVEFAKIETLIHLLPARVSSPLSVFNLAQSLDSSHPTIKGWLKILELIYLVFSVPTWTGNVARSIQKEQKWYFWDWGVIETEAVRFENFVAVMLKRAICAWNEQGHGPYSLYYVRNRAGEEVDFAIADRKRVHVLIEVKLSDEHVSKSLLKFKLQTGAKLAFQVLYSRGFCQLKDKDVYVIGIDRLLNLLP